MTAPISRSPLTPLQVAIVAKLKGDAALVVLLNAVQAVYDQPPEPAEYPYVSVGDHLSTPDNDLTSYGREVTETIHVWTQARSNASGQAIANRIIELLDHQERELPVAGHKVVSVRHEFDQALTDPDPQIRHHVVRMRFVLAQVN